MRMNKILFCGVMFAIGLLTPIAQAAFQICLGANNECPNGMFSTTEDPVGDQPTPKTPTSPPPTSRSISGAEVQRIAHLQFPQNLQSFKDRWGQPFYESGGLVRWRSGFADINAVLDETGTKVVVMDVNQ